MEAGQVAKTLGAMFIVQASHTCVPIGMAITSKTVTVVKTFDAAMRILFAIAWSTAVACEATLALIGCSIAG